MTSPPMIYVLHGPNLTRLGTREPEIYGADTLADIDAALERHAHERGVAVTCRQSNHEGELVDWLLEADEAGARAVILNAAAYTHTSLAIHDAIRAIDVPVIDVHLSNVAARGPMRRRNLVAPVAAGSISGFGATGYRLALDAALALP